MEAGGGGRRRCEVRVDDTAVPRTGAGIGAVGVQDDGARDELLPDVSSTNLVPNAKTSEDYSYNLTVATEIISPIAEKTVATEIISSIVSIVSIAPIVEKIIPVENVQRDIFSQLESYSNLEPNWDGPDSVIPSRLDIDRVINFVETIPVIFPQPKAMISRNGDIELYWDDSIVYIDIQFEPDNMLSLFSRNRSSGEERFFDTVDIATIDSNWYFDALDVLLNSPESASV